MKQTYHTAIIASTDRALILAQQICKEFPEAKTFSTRTDGGASVETIATISSFLEENFNHYTSFVFIGALGICVRSIAPYIKDKNTDPAIINLDDHGFFVQPVLSGHLGGANALARQVARLLGAQAVITTSSDLQDIWALDTLSKQYGWKSAATKPLNTIISLFVNNRPVALLLDVKDKGTEWLLQTKPDFVSVFYKIEEIPIAQFDLLIAVTYRKYEVAIPTLYYHPAALHMGMGCSRDIETDLLEASVAAQLAQHGLAQESVKSIASIDIKHDEVAFMALANKWQIPFHTYTAEALNTCEVANPSEVVKSKLDVYSVSEAASALSSRNSSWLLEKQKVKVASGKMHTIAVALEASLERRAQIAIVGAGPGDAELIAVKGKALLQAADLILYAGSLVPEEQTHYAKSGAVVQNSAGMTLEEQIALMEEHYAKGHLIVRLQSGDPSIYGAIQEQMTIFDEKGMDYFIVPGISSFQAAAAVLKSEFTIPEVVQSIILTRGEGNTPLPENEKLQEMAKHRATMCIFLSATIAKNVQAQLLEHYPPETPVAVLYRVTWKDERIFVGQLHELASMVRTNKLTRTALIIVGTAIGARKNRSHLYNPDWKHIFRNQKTNNKNDSDKK
ncbi:precorrin-4 C11-methyltransferase [Chitinophaga niastensis]|uniref:Precorrin-4 C11-methyltransferase n=1 Tax=Chitinophaga niastensis TaxID=536980 RepID=A0A2P8HGY8_CHINA|nr:precorrin-4 C(11)-methyltransferase [Chitinophaga niastensis]PSL45483.1 precorrin-4 C11-methyltransferase [Chitinophaga niastensis]